MVQHYQPSNLIELGTSLGITTSYFAAAKNSLHIFTCEGAKEIAAIAQQNFNALAFNNITLVEGDFNNTLPKILTNLSAVDFAFIDGNHRKQPTLNYFQQILEKTTETSIMVFDDIHWSEEMEQAWYEIQQHPAVTLTIDLFFIGIVCFNKDIKVKQHFIISY